MEKLIPILSKLQSVCDKTGSAEIKLPKIVVVGSQSSGKSSVLERLLGKKFLPKGTGTVTRCPIVMDLVSTPGQPESEDYVEFQNQPGKKFQGCQNIRMEIEAETKRKAGTNLGITKDSLFLRVYSAKVPNITVVDLPGLVKVPIGDQPKDIEYQIDDLVRSFISNEKCIILAVCEANADISTYESVKLAKEVDPCGIRTLLVLTKLDRMDAGTDASSVLNGDVMNIKLGIIGMVNNAELDNKKDKSLLQAETDELNYLKEHYPGMVSKCGIGFLRSRLNQIFSSHVKSCLTELDLRVSDLIQKYQSDIEGTEVTDGHTVVSRLINAFLEKYKTSLFGSGLDLGTDRLAGGARVTLIFEQLNEELYKLSDNIYISDTDILIAISNSRPLEGILSQMEGAIRSLMRQEVRKLDRPVHFALSIFQEEMQQVIRDCAENEVSQFPKLQAAIDEVANKLLIRTVHSSKQMIENFLKTQQVFTSIVHKDFQDEINNILRQFDTCQLDIDKNTVGIHNNNNNFASKNISTPSPTDDCISMYEEFAVGDVGDKGKSRKRWFGKKKKHLLQKEESSFYLEEEHVNETSRDAFDKLRMIVRKFVEIARDNIQDFVPKSIVTSVMYEINTNIGAELMINLLSPERVEGLMELSEVQLLKRCDALEMLEVLKKTSIAIGNIRTSASS